MNNQQPSVFISYAREDIEMVGKIYDDLASFIFQLTLCWIQLVLCRDAWQCVSEQRKGNHFFVLNFQRIESPFFARRRIAMRLYKPKLNHNFGKVLTTFQRI